MRPLRLPNLACHRAVRCHSGSGALLWWAVADLTVGLFAPLASALTIWLLLGGTVALAVVTILRRPWAAALLALAAVPSLVRFIPLIVLNALQPEDGATQPVALLLLVLGTLLLHSSGWACRRSRVTTPQQQGNPLAWARTAR